MDKAITASVIAGLAIGTAFVIGFAVMMSSPNFFIPEKYDMTGIFVPTQVMTVIA